jgi:hypothetical protein
MLLSPQFHLFLSFALTKNQVISQGHLYPEAFLYGQLLKLCLIYHLKFFFQAHTVF